LQMNTAEASLKIQRLIANWAIVARTQHQAAIADPKGRG